MRERLHFGCRVKLGTFNIDLPVLAPVAPGDGGEEEVGSAHLPLLLVVDPSTVYNTKG